MRVGENHLSLSYFPYDNFIEGNISEVRDRTLEMSSITAKSLNLIEIVSLYFYLTFFLLFFAF